MFVFVRSVVLIVVGKYLEFGARGSLWCATAVSQISANSGLVRVGVITLPRAVERTVWRQIIRDPYFEMEFEFRCGVGGRGVRNNASRGTQY